MKKSVVALLVVLIIFFSLIAIVFFLLNLGINDISSDGDIGASQSEVTSSQDSISSENNSNMSEDNTTSLDDSSSSEEPIEEEPVINIDTSAWNLLLVNWENSIPSDYPVQLAEFENGYQVDARIIPEMRAMFDTALSEGYDLMVGSAYRSYDYQTGLFDRQVQRNVSQGYANEEAIAVAATVVAKPGTSEHQTGMAVDIVTPEYQRLDEGIAQRPEIQWLFEHAHEYGFILRYPQDKTETTKIIYEPWHYRYVGVEAATYMKENNLVLEEYLALATN